MSTRIPSQRPSARPPAQKAPPPVRKVPRQARSRATVEAILQAGARVLGNRGLDAFTTNEVAEVAGVSIGSLYQYFPDKLSLIDAIRRRHLDDVLSVLRQTEQGQKSLSQLATELVDGMIKVHSIEPALHRVLLDEAPRYDGSRAIQGIFETEYMGRYNALVAAGQSRATQVDIDIAAQVLSSAVEGVIHNAARRGMLASLDLKRELVHLVCTYLAAPLNSGPRHRRLAPVS